MSCLNLYLPQTPRVLGAPAEFMRRGGLPFRQTLALTPDEHANPWRLLQRDWGPGIAQPSAILIRRSGFCTSVWATTSRLRRA